MIFFQFVSVSVFWDVWEVMESRSCLGSFAVCSLQGELFSFFPSEIRSTTNVLARVSLGNGRDGSLVPRLRA